MLPQLPIFQNIQANSFPPSFTTFCCILKLGTTFHHILFFLPSLLLHSPPHLIKFQSIPPNCTTFRHITSVFITFPDILILSTTFYEISRLSIIILLSRQYSSTHYDIPPLSTISQYTSRFSFIFLQFAQRLGDTPQLVKALQKFLLPFHRFYHFAAHFSIFPLYFDI